MGIKYIDAKRLRRILIGGALWVKKHEDYLNELNVYPVPDGDTGSNMSMTLETMKADLEANTTKKSSMQEIIDIVEESVLMGARGNSGTILSQIITGFLKGIGNKKRLELQDLIIALKSAKDVAYSAVDTPVEGTILTVIRKISDKAQELSNEDISLDVLLEKLTIAAKEAVDDTPNLLPKLKEAGVVDSGGMGLYYFFIGLSKTLAELDEIATSENDEKSFSKKLSDISHDPATIKFKYCTEFIIRNGDFDISKFKEDILKLGDSAVFAQTSKKFKIHVHTNNPGQALELGVMHGDLEKIKIENMKLQNEGLISSEHNQSKIFVNPKQSINKYAYVILADSHNLKEEFIKLGADVVILGGQSQNPSVSDILSAIAKVTTNKQIVILPNNKNVISTANIAVEKTEKNAIVIPTRTMLEGYYYLRNSFDSLNNLKINEALNFSIEITKAVRETTVDNLQIYEGDYIALVNTKIKHVNSSLEDLVDEVIEKYVTKNSIKVTVVQGSDKDDDVTEKLALIKNVNIIDGNQENYNYYIYIQNKAENMPEIAIITDSSSELTEEELDNLPIFVLPIRLEANDVNYRDGVDLSKEEFWNKLINEEAVFKSAQPSPMELMNLYNNIFEKGFKKILLLNISSNMSGTFNTSKMVARKMNKENDIVLFDTEQVSIPLGELVLGVANKIKKKDSMQEILRWAKSFKEHSKTLFVVEDLKYLERGGRISKVAKSIGDFLNLKPVITILQGSITVEKKVFGEKAALSYIEKTVNNLAKKQSVYVMPVWGGSNKERENITLILESLKNNPKITVVNKNRIVGPTVGSHSGPVYGICVIPKLL